MTLSSPSVGFTPGCRTVLVDAPTRLLSDGWTTSPIAVSHAVRLLDEPAAATLSAGSLRVLRDERSPDLIDVALAYLARPADGSAPRATYGPLVDREWRHFGGDVADFLGVARELPDGRSEPRLDYARCVDCSGYVRLVFGHFGLPLSLGPLAGHLPKRSAEMAIATIGRIVEEARPSGVGIAPGDLLCFASPGHDRVNHVGIYLGRDLAGRPRFIHSASAPNGPVLGEQAPGHPPLLDSDYWAPRLRLVRRL